MNDKDAMTRKLKSYTRLWFTLAAIIFVVLSVLSSLIVEMTVGVYLTNLFTSFTVSDVILSLFVDIEVDETLKKGSG